MIETTLTLRQAEELFEAEGVLFDSVNVFPVFRAVELFGSYAGFWIREHTGQEPHQLNPGKDWNARGACTVERPLIDYLYLSGFFKLVTEHNYRILAQRCKTIEATV